MLGLTAAQWNALYDAPERWTRIPKSYKHGQSTLEALDTRRLVHHRINVGHGDFEWKVTATGKHLRDATQRLVDRVTLTIMGGVG